MRDYAVIGRSKEWKLGLVKTSLASLKTKSAIYEFRYWPFAAAIVQPAPTTTNRPQTATHPGTDGPHTRDVCTSRLAYIKISGKFQGKKPSPHAFL
eukprot:805742-Prymnesium_polylepis.1